MLGNAAKGIGAGMLALAAVVVLFVVSAVLGLGFVAYNAWFAKQTVHNRVVSQVYNPVFAQQAYESFYTNCTAIVALNNQVITATSTIQDLKAAGADSFQLSQAITTKQAYQNRQDTIAADYNAASAEWTRNDFKGADLPVQITPPYKNVTCGGGNYGGNHLGSSS